MAHFADVYCNSFCHVPFFGGNSWIGSCGVHESEEGKFERLLATSKGDDMAKLYSDFYTWLEVIDPKLSRGGFRGIIEVQPSFSTVLEDLETALVEPEKVSRGIEMVQHTSKEERESK